MEMMATSPKQAITDSKLKQPSHGTLTKTIGNTADEKLNWVQIVSRFTRGKLRHCHKVQMAKLENQKILDTAKAQLLYKHKPTANYFKNIHCVPIGSIRRTLKECLPSWPLLSIIFEGRSIFEIIPDERQKDRLVETLQMENIWKVKKFNIFTVAMNKDSKDGESHEGTMPRDLEMAAKPIPVNVKKTRSEVARRWCITRLHEAEKNS